MIQENTIPYAIHFLIERQAKDENMWKHFVDVFREQPDSKNHGYRGEYWGKTMRGCVLLYQYSHDEKLYEILENTVEALLKNQEENGRISAYKKEEEFCGWDMWARKYITVSLEYFLTICKKEDLRQRIMTALKKHLAYIMDRVGEREGKIPLLRTTDDKRYCWGGVNSASILKAFVVFYELTGEQKYLDFAKYIISTGGMRGFNVFENAYQNKVKPREYAYPKAYEVTSCFEGLLEYYKVTGEEKALQTCVNYAEALLQEEWTVIGSGGTECECFSFSSERQTDPKKRPEQETCVTVSYMLYFGALYEVTKDKKYADAMEISFYNAYMGVLNTVPNRHDLGLPVDWYSPLVAGTRHNMIPGGRQIFSDGYAYSCCTAISPVGAGLMGIMEYTETSVLFYSQRELSFPFGLVKEKTDYPKSGNIEFTFPKTDRPVELSFRIPSWCEQYEVEGSDFREEKGFLYVKKQFAEGDKIILRFAMPIRTLTKKMSSFQGEVFAVQKGATVFALDGRKANTNLIATQKPKFADCTDKDAFMALKMTIGEKEYTLVDYASAGKDPKKRVKVCAWIPYITSGKHFLRCRLDRSRVRK